MLYAFGGDKIKSRVKMRATLDALVKRAPFAHTIRITNEDAEHIDVKNLLDAQGLFYAKRIVIFDNTLKEKSIQKKIFPHLKDMAASNHVFLFLEEEIGTDVRKNLLAHATKTSIRDSSDAGKKDAADWSATNALERRDSKQLWLALARACAKGAAPEQTHGQLFWKAKQILLEKKFRRWDEASAKKLVIALAELPHEARRCGTELELALERFAFEI